MKYVFDIDQTLLFTEFDRTNNRYAVIGVNKPLIKIVNTLYDSGNIIILLTGRHWDKYEMTKEQVDAAGVKYHSLVLGKVPGIIIDDMSFKPEDFIKFFDEGGLENVTI